MHKFVIPVVLAIMLGACSKKEEAPPPPATAPQSEAPTPAPAPSAPAGGEMGGAPAGGEMGGAPPGGGMAAAPAGGEMAADTGEHVYSTVCTACHGTGVAGAPKFGDKKAWAPHVAKGKDVLYKHAIEGFTGTSGTMPPKGGNPDLSDADVKAAVDYMVSKVQG
jgi:cytochrome c5